MYLLEDEVRTIDLEIDHAYFTCEVGFVSDMVSRSNHRLFGPGIKK